MQPLSLLRRPRRDTEFSAGSIALTIVALVLAALLAPMAVAAVATPLPAGSYDVDVDGAAVNVTVSPTGSVAVSAEDGIIVELEFDGEGRALDRFVATTQAMDYEVDVEVHEDGTYSATVLEEPEESSDDRRTDTTGTVQRSPGIELATNHGELVSAVARCAPRGRLAESAGWPNHGTVVSAAASGLTLTVPVTDAATGARRDAVADLGTVGGVIAFCELADDVRDGRTSGASHTVD